MQIQRPSTKVISRISIIIADMEDDQKVLHMRGPRGEDCYNDDMSLNRKSYPWSFGRQEY